MKKSTENIVLAMEYLGTACIAVSIFSTDIFLFTGLGLWTVAGFTYLFTGMRLFRKGLRK